MKSERIKKIGKIEFLRFVFSVIIFIHHSRSMLGDERCKFLGGSFAVEFFFLLSGYLMMAAIYKKIIVNAGTEKLGQETLFYLWKKVKSVYPGVVISWVIAVAFVAFCQRKTLRSILTLVIDSFFEVTLIKMSGIYSISLNGVVWYISSMLLCMAVLYPLIRKYPDMMMHVGLPLIVLISLGYLSGNYGAPRNLIQWIEFTKKGNIRALGELSLGAMSFCFVNHFKDIRLTKQGKFFVSVIEWGSYIIVILFMYYLKASERDYFFLFIMVLAVTLSFSQKGIDSDFFDKPFFMWLGKYSFYLFLGHTFYAQNLNFILPEAFSDGQKMGIYSILAITTSFGIWGIELAIAKLMPRVRLFLEKWFIEGSIVV